MVVDHSNDDQVKNLFEQVKDENSGRLDVLVNNAYAGVDMIFSNSRKKFYELDPILHWDTINGVGLRNHFLCTTYASRYELRLSKTWDLWPIYQLVRHVCVPRRPNFD